MKPDPLDDLLRDYANQPLRMEARSQRSDVWAKIEARKRGRDWLGVKAVFSWRDLFAEPRLAIAGLVLASVTSIVPVAAAAGSLDTSQKMRDSLHLKCFMHCSSCLTDAMRSGGMR